MKQPPKDACANTISIFELMRKFPDEGAAIAHLEALRWSGGVDCPRCGVIGKASRHNTRPGFWHCQDCRGFFTVRTGTVFERSSIPLHKWICAIYVLQTAREGVSSFQLSKEIGIRQRSAWLILHGLRDACDIRAIKLTGIAEADETYIGDKKSEARRRSTLKQGLLELRECGSKRRTKLIPNTTHSTPQGEVGKVPEPSATIYTDEHAGCWPSVWIVTTRAGSVASRNSSTGWHTQTT